MKTYAELFRQAVQAAAVELRLDGSDLLISESEAERAFTHEMNGGAPLEDAVNRTLTKVMPTHTSWQLAKQQFRADLLVEASHSSSSGGFIRTFKDAFDEARKR